MDSMKDTTRDVALGMQGGITSAKSWSWWKFHVGQCEYPQRKDYAGGVVWQITFCLTAGIGITLGFSSWNVDG